MHNPFRRAARNGAPDMRVTAPPSAETPMTKPWLQYPPDNTLVGVCDITGEEWNHPLSVCAFRDLYGA